MKKSNENEDKLDLKFESGVSKLLKKTYPAYELDSRANTFISKHINLIFNAYIKNVKDLNVELPKVEDIQKITEKFLPPNLKKYAISEAQKEVFMAQTFSLNFVPNRKRIPGEAELKLIAAAKKKERDLFCRDFDSGIKTVLNDSLPNHKLDKKGSQKMSSYLLELSESITARLKHHKPNHRTVEDIQQIVQDLFPSSLAEHAKSEGQRMLFEYNNKLFQFYPEKYKGPAPAVSSKMSLEGKRKKEAEKELKSGLSILSEEIHNHSSLNKEAQTLICKELSDLKYFFIDYLIRSGQPKTHEVIQNAVLLLFPPLMAEHAIAEGQKMLRRFETGEFSLEPIHSHSKEKVSKDKGNKKSDKAIPKTFFESGVISVGSVTQPTATLHKSSSSIVSETLDNFFTCLIKTIHDSSTSDISISDVQSAAKQIVPESLLEHALAEGEKMIRLYESGALKFVPKRKKLS